MRAMYPKRTITSANDGRSRYFTCVAAFDPGGAVAVTGSHLSQIPKMMMSTIAVTNSGPAVGETSLLERRDDASEDAERDDEDERDRPELQRVDERGPEEVPDGNLVLQRRPHVAAQESRDPIRVLRQYGAVHSELVVER